MKKKFHCKNCNNSFEKNINSVDDLNNITCPKCMNKIDGSNHYNITSDISNTSGKYDGVILRLFNIFRYSFIIPAILGIVLYHTGNNFGLYICAIVSALMYIIFRLIDISILPSILITSIISVLICFKIHHQYYDSIALGVCYGIMASMVLRWIRMFIFSMIIRAISKN